MSARDIRVEAYDFPAAREQWRSVPMVGQSVDADVLLACPEWELRNMLAATLAQRTAIRGWEAMWPSSEFGGLGTHVLDFGCGSGVESLRWAAAGARVTLVDISPSNLALAARSYCSMGLQGRIGNLSLAVGEQPYFADPFPVNLFLASGVIHHIPYAPDLMRRVARSMAPSGTALLLLYTDRAFEFYERDFAKFVAGMDPVGNYSDWYDAEKVAQKFGDAWKLEEFRYLSESGVNESYAVARLRVIK